MELGERKLQENPRQSANLISILFFGWSIPIFKKTYNKTLDSNDACEPLLQDRSIELGNRLERYICLLLFEPIERKLTIMRN